MLHAKTRREELSLEEHSHDAMSWAERIFQGRKARAWARFFNVEDVESMISHIILASLFHDIGKASNYFQNMVCKGTHVGVRHEHISAYLLLYLRDWLAQCASWIDVDCIIAAVLSHHFKAYRANPPPNKQHYLWGATLPGPITHYFDDAEVTRILRSAADFLGIERPRTLPPKSWRPPGAACIKQANLYGRALRKDPKRAALCRAVKMGVVVADATASSVAASPSNIAHVAIERALRAGPLKPSTLDPLCGDEKALRSFQREADRTGPRAFLGAPCGSGKTLASWRWARERLREDEYGHVIFLYPTRGTALEGYRGVADLGLEVSLIHSTAHIDLRMIQEMEDEEESVPLSMQRATAMQMWGSPIITATVDQFLGHLAHRYKSVCLLPILVDAVVIFDEIHSFDPQLFSLLREHLEFHAASPTLCLSATLTPQHKSILEGHGLKEIPYCRTKHTSRKRYRIEEGKGPGRDDKKTLHVVNTVDRCMDGAGQGLIYHSRFRYYDRLLRHHAVMEAFQSDRPCYVRSTQVCEMSLDIDADRLITEAAPIGSLIQRLGRVARAYEGDGMGEIFFYAPEGDLPYTKAEVDLGLKFLRALTGRDVSIDEIFEEYRALIPEETFADARRHQPEGYFATRTAVREFSHSVRCLLDTDIPLLRGKRWLDHTIQIPVFYLGSVMTHVEDRGRIPDYITSIDGRRYDPLTGYRCKIRSNSPLTSAP